MTRAGAWCTVLVLATSAPAAAQEDEAPVEPADEASPSLTAPPATPLVSDALRAEIDRIVDEKLQAKLAELPASAPPEPPPPVSFTLKGDFFTKVLLRNNTSGGCVSYGNPAPEGDNFAGDNGLCSELGLTLTGRVSDRVEAGARLQTRFGAEWADWYENGDERDAADGSGESLGQNHAAYLQLRGVYLRIAPPIPTIRSVHVGATDLGMYNPWTIGKARYTERDNARAALLDGSFGAPFSYTLGVIALPKLYAGPGYTTGIADPLIDNPFWQRDFAWAGKLKHDNDWFGLEHITSAVLDEEADLDDPDAVGSTNAVDARDGGVVTNLRYVNTNHTLEMKSNAIDWLGLSALVGYSYSRTDDALVFNSVSGAQGFTPAPMGEHHGYAAVARVELFDPADIDLDLQLEYFNIGTDWVAVMGARREADVLLTDGFVDGQVPTLNVANEFQDFTEAFYEPVVGWHGSTAVLTWRPGALELAGEGTFLEYNTDTGAGSLDTDKTYPDFLSTDGMTDTDLFTFANTNDRGRDPRSVYHEHQNRRTLIAMVKGAYTLDVLKTVVLRAKSKLIYDTDQRDQSIEEADNYSGLLFFNKASVEAPITDELSAAVGYGLDAWFEEHRSGEVIAGVADYPNYVTIKHKVFTDLRYVFGGANLWMHVEYLNKDLDASDDRLDQRGLGVLRAIGTVSASF
ncbi:MAG: hypothetical protein IT383_19190 [Deltaproteobacteria bacterium]|nr:hypothetical protein [Deltaproteobacteria bacterium]